MFLERQLFRTRSRNGVLVLASLFERHVEIVADIGFDGRVDAAQWRSVVDTMTPALRGGPPGRRVPPRLDAHRGDARRRRASRADPSGGNDLANRPIETQGER